MRPGGEKKSECDAARLDFSMMDNERYFRDIIDKPTWRTRRSTPSIPAACRCSTRRTGPAAAAPITVDARNLRDRLETLRTLAEATDGIAVMNNNDLDTGLKRISDDLSSYYLLGYYSSNGKLDGRFHNIKVRVKRPGVDVRARKGYRAATRGGSHSGHGGGAGARAGLARERHQRDLLARARFARIPV